MEKATEFKRLTSKEAAEEILKIKNPAVLIHVRPDGDAVGSGAALSLIFRQLGYNAPVISADKIPERLLFILKKTETVLTESAKGCTPVSIDTASMTQLGTLAESSAQPQLMIDHHAVGTQYADGYINPNASSAAEALLDIAYELENMGKIKINEPLAYAIYAAISSDTGCFCYSNATPKTHRYAANLIEFGIDTADINHRLFNSKTKKQIRAEGFVASNLKTALEGKICYATVSLAQREALLLDSEQFDTAIDIVRSVEGVEIAFVIKETEKNKYKVSLRSTGADVAKIAAQLGGGGHVRAAGCSLQAECIADACEIILTELSKLL